MKVKYFLGFGFWVLGFAFVFAQPKLSVKEGTKFQLGEAKEGAILEQKLTLQNVGKDTLIIEDIRATCGCTTTKTHKKRLGTNDTTALTISVNTKGFKGPVKKEIFITTNDPKQADLEVELLVTIRNVIEFEPSFVNFRTVNFGKPAKQSITIRNTSEKPISITSVTSPDSQIIAKPKTKTIQPKSSTQLIVSLSAKKKGKILGQLLITTNHPEKDSLRLSYVGEIK
ncbi:MAG: DUF1573 domain-containing protein [Ignavibacteriae bacterium]|nr:DUF1573 domain-containing protein [Ignavibacteriota bacterium]